MPTRDWIRDCQPIGNDLSLWTLDVDYFDFINQSMENRDTTDYSIYRPIHFLSLFLTFYSFYFYILHTNLYKYILCWLYFLKNHHFICWLNLVPFVPPLPKTDNLSGGMPMTTITRSQNVSTTAAEWFPTWNIFLPFYFFPSVSLYLPLIRKFNIFWEFYLRRKIKKNVHKWESNWMTSVRIGLLVFSVDICINGTMVAWWLCVRVTNKRKKKIYITRRRERSRLIRPVVTICINWWRKTFSDFGARFQFSHLAINRNQRLSRFHSALDFCYWSFFQKMLNRFGLSFLLFLLRLSHVRNQKENLNVELFISLGIFQTITAYKFWPFSSCRFHQDRIDRRR